MSRHTWVVDDIGHSSLGGRHTKAPVIGGHVPVHLARRASRSSSGLLATVRIGWRVIRIVVGTIVAAAVLVSLSVFGLSATNSARFVPVLSNSMAPSMPVGSIALTLPVARQDVRVGDVIVFTDPLQPSIRVIHRVTHVFTPSESSEFSNWSTNKLFINTKGDNNPSADPWVVTIADATVWKKSGSVDTLGFPAIWVANPMLRIAMFLFFGVIIALWALVALWRRPSANNAASPVSSEVRE